MPSQVVPFLRCDKGSDWSRDELAQLYRIENGLAQARLALETDRGVTDEGDPWFVFCRGDGEVLVHICRIGYVYYLHSPVLPQALAGRSLPTLTKSFVSQIPLCLPVPAAQGAQLFVHPASMLAVVIATIFYIAQDVRFSEQGADGASATDEASSGGRNSLKGSIQAAFQSHIDFLASFRDWVSAQNSAYLILVGTVTAFVDGVVPDFGWGGIAADAGNTSVGDAARADDMAVIPSLPDVSTADAGERLAMPGNLLVDGETGNGEMLLFDSGAVVPAVKHVSLELATSTLAGHIEKSFIAAWGLNAAQEGGYGVAPGVYHYELATELVASAQGDTWGSNAKAANSDSSQAASPTSISGDASSQSTALVAGSAEADSVFSIAADNSHSGGGFTGYLDTLKLNLSTALLTLTDQDLGRIFDAATLTFNAENLGTIIAAAEPITGQDDLAGVGLGGDASASEIAYSNILPLYDDAAVRVVNAFLEANPTAEIIFDQHGNVIVCDGQLGVENVSNPAVNDGSNLTVVQMWETEHGFTIALVGYVDDELAA